MTAEMFVYWFQGFLEIAKPKVITEEQIKIIEDHIKLVLEKKTPTYGGITSGSGKLPTWSRNFDSYDNLPDIGHGLTVYNGPPASC